MLFGNKQYENTVAMQSTVLEMKKIPLFLPVSRESFYPLELKDTLPPFERSLFLPTIASTSKEMIRYNWLHFVKIPPRSSPGRRKKIFHVLRSDVVTHVGILRTILVFVKITLSPQLLNGNKIRGIYFTALIGPETICYKIIASATHSDGDVVIVDHI